MNQVKQRRQRRPRTKGVAALEFALSLTFLAPLIGAALDFGYYFYVGSSAEEAARAGVRQAVTKFLTDNGPAAVCTGLLASPPNPTANYVSGNNGEPYNVMNQSPLGMGANTTTIISCDANPVDPSWHVQVKVDFRPAMGIVANFMPAGTPIAGQPTVRYSSATLVSN